MRWGRPGATWSCDCNSALSASEIAEKTTQFALWKRSKRQREDKAVAHSLEAGHDTLGVPEPVEL